MTTPAVHRRLLADRIAAVAGELFYREGIHRVGVDRVAAAAEVTKRTLYRYFPSKDELVAAAIRRSPKIRFPNDGVPPQERIVGAFRAMLDSLQATEYRGCPYIIVAAELIEPTHPARIVVKEIALRRRRWFLECAAAAGAHDPELLAEQLDVLFDGALASAMKRHDLVPAQAALMAVQTLLASSITPARRSEGRKAIMQKKKPRHRLTSAPPSQRFS
jgi:AcrR family transcriptional regulator